MNTEIPTPKLRSMELLLNAKTGLGGHYSFVSQLIRLHIDQDILDRLRGKLDYDDIEDAILYTRLAHEYAHFVQNYTTTFGLLKTLNSRIQALGIIAAIVEASQSGTPPLFPLNEYLPRGKKFADHSTWQASAAHSKIGMNVFNYFESGGLVEKIHKFRDVAQPLGRTTPTLTTSRGSFKLTATALMEFQALSQQMDTADKFKSIRRAFADEIAQEILNRPSVKNLGALASHAFRSPKMSRMLHQTMYEMVTIALNPELPEALSESFRWIEVEFGAIERSKKLVPWELLHPGWRLMRLIEFIRENGYPLPKNAPDMSALLSEVLSKLGWKRQSACLLSAKEAIELNSLSLPEISNDSTLSKHLTNIVWKGDFASMPIFEIAFADPILRAYVRGPHRTNQLINAEACLMDDALSNLYTKSYECCVCFDVVEFCKGHAEGCPIPSMWAGVISNGKL